MTDDELTTLYAKAWRYLCSYSGELRGRENGKMDLNDKWWAYVYPKNLDKQETPKLLVAQTVPSLRVSNDADGKFYVNNVWVNGIIPAPGRPLGFLLGVLNSTVADFVFRRIAKLKDNNFFEANKQFIAPLPVPRASAEQRDEIAIQAGEIQDLNSRRRELLEGLQRRLKVLKPTTKTEVWLFPELAASDEFRAKTTTSKDRRLQKAKREQAISAKHQDIALFLRPGARVESVFQDGELRVLVDNAMLSIRFLSTTYLAR